MTFRVGQKVVCVNASGDAANLLTHGAVYTIEVVKEGTFLSGRRGKRVVSGVGVTLHEVTIGDSEWFNARRFSLHVAAKTDISFAHEILRKVSRKQTERA